MLQMSAKTLLKTAQNSCLQWANEPTLAFKINNEQKRIIHFISQENNMYSQTQVCKISMCALSISARNDISGFEKKSQVTTQRNVIYLNS